MKKTLFILVALSLVFGTMALAKEGENKAVKPQAVTNVKSMPAEKADKMIEISKEQEKISSPAEIGNFANIVKKGKDLYGMRKQILEKIAHPSEIINFENIKKAGNALWGMRKQDDQTLVRPEAVTCVKTALDTKDNALKTGITNGAANLTTLVEARNTCQKAALDKTTIKEQKEANRSCVETYKKGIETGKETVKKVQKEVWEKFRNDLKTCGQLQKAAGGTEEIKLEDGGLGMEL